MFAFCMIVSMFLLIGAIAAFQWNKAIFVLCAVLCLGVFFYAWSTPQGELYLKKLTAATEYGNWLVVDCSGGVTMRHWVLENGYVKDSDQSDGWQFYDSEGNLCYLSGDAFVMRIKGDLTDFKENYREQYNVPADQIALR